MDDATASSPLAERREQILGELAEGMHAAAREAQRRLLQAETADDFARLAGSLAKLARGVRQCVGLQARLEKDRLADEAETALSESLTREDAVETRKARIRRAVGRALQARWPDDDDLARNDAFDERLERLDARLEDLAEAEDFLDLDPDVLIGRLRDELGVDLADPPLLPASLPREAGAGEREAADGAGPANRAGPTPARSLNGHREPRPDSS